MCLHHTELSSPLTPDVWLGSLSQSSHPRPLQRFLPCSDPMCPALLDGTTQDLSDLGHRVREVLPDCTALDSIAQGFPQTEVLLKGAAPSCSQTRLHPYSMSPSRRSYMLQKAYIGYHAPVHLKRSNQLEIKSTWSCSYGFGEYETGC